MQGVNLQPGPGGQIQHNDVGIITSGLHYFRQNHGSLGIIRSAATGQNQLAVRILLRQLVRLNHPQGVFQAVETRNLGQDWS